MEFAFAVGLIDDTGSVFSLFFRCLVIYRDLLETDCSKPRINLPHRLHPHIPLLIPTLHQHRTHIKLPLKSLIIQTEFLRRSVLIPLRNRWIKRIPQPHRRYLNHINRKSHQHQRRHRANHRPIRTRPSIVQMDRHAKCVQISEEIPPTRLGLRLDIGF